MRHLDRPAGARRRRASRTARRSTDRPTNAPVGRAGWCGEPGSHAQLLPGVPALPVPPAPLGADPEPVSGSAPPEPMPPELVPPEPAPAPPELAAPPLDGAPPVLGIPLPPWPPELEDPPAPPAAVPPPEPEAPPEPLPPPPQAASSGSGVPALSRPKYAAMAGPSNGTECSTPERENVSYTVKPQSFCQYSRVVPDVGVSLPVGAASRPSRLVHSFTSSAR